MFEVVSQGFRSDQSLLRALALPGDERRAIGTLTAPLLFRAGEPLALMPSLIVR